MSIDPKTAAKQRWGVAKAIEVKCACGARTRDVSGRCRVCRITLPKIAGMRTEDLIRLATIVGAEIRKRNTAICRAVASLRADMESTG